MESCEGLRHENMRWVVSRCESGFNVHLAIDSSNWYVASVGVVMSSEVLNFVRCLKRAKIEVGQLEAQDDEQA